MPLGRITEHPTIVHLTRTLAARAAGGQGSASHAFPAADGRRPAAVALVLRLGDGDTLELLFVERAAYSSDPWSAQVAFPGGRMEPGDASPMETAIRETYEETGVQLHAEGEILGALDDVVPHTVQRPSLVVRPFVAVTGRGEARPMSAEIGATFWVPLPVLQGDGAWRDTTVVAHGATLQVRAAHHAGYVIWGMTARILQQFLACLPEGERRTSTAPMSVPLRP